MPDELAPDELAPAESAAAAPRVTGIGGAFLYSADARALAAWYADRLGVGPIQYNPDEDAHYCEFTTPAAGSPGGVLRTVWAVFQSKEPLTQVRRAFVVNYRVRDLDALLARLRAGGVAVEKTQDESYGRFAWVHDPDGNRIELYQELA
jgi:catechol 2,3-dioxygenase-like lactoylglutathione lyase family enzyme